MNNLLTRITALGALMLIPVAALTGCGEGSDSLPSLTADGKSYAVTRTEVKANDEGGTSVLLYGPDFGTSADNGTAVKNPLPFGADCVADGETYSDVGVSLQTRAYYEFRFEGQLAPDELKVYLTDKPEDVTVIPLD
ncbi:MAG: hypothetical protein LBK95_14885 [Bifidobacteriaceae bacterium]|jgi:hypothetical protein|nr:hypothetical protein [Bifidobacteriaceae bacterium]